jgi:hypothetical protein
MGHYNASDSQIVQEDSVGGHSLNGGPVFWQRSSANGGPVLYNWSGSDTLKAFPFNGSQFATSPSQQGAIQPSWPGGFLALSANSDQPGSGVIWATIATGGSLGGNPPAPGALYAFDAGNLSNELWDSTQNAARDGLGDIGKFVPPMVANGKVYLATWSNQVLVYGLLSTLSVSKTALSFGNEPLNSASAPMPVTVTNTGVVPLSITNISLSNTSPHPFSQTNNCGSAVAVNASCTINVVFNPGALGAAAATLSIATGASTGTQTVALSGAGTAAGTAPSYTVSTTTLAFGSQTVNSASAPMPVTVTNTGVVALPIPSITLSSTSPQPYSQTNTCGTSVAVGGSCTINVVFNPASPGAASATLAINAGTTASNVSLSGTGTFQVTLTASTQIVTAGVPVTLTWSSPANASCTASGGNSSDNWSGALAASGSQSVTESAAGNYTYGLTCSSQGTSANATVAVAMTVPTVTLTASPTSVNVGQSVTLSWGSQNATTCSGTGGLSGDGWSSSQPLQGSATISMGGSGIAVFTLTCSAGPKSTAATATVMVASTSNVVGGKSSGGGGGALGGLDLLLLSMAMMRAIRQRRLGATSEPTPGVSG